MKMTLIPPQRQGIHTWHLPLILAAFIAALCAPCLNAEENSNSNETPSMYLASIESAIENIPASAELVVKLHAAISGQCLSIPFALSRTDAVVTLGFSFSKLHPNEINEAIKLHVQGTCQLLSNNFSDARKAFSQELAIGTSLNNEVIVQAALNNQAVADAAAGRFDIALRSMQDLLKRYTTTLPTPASELSHHQYLSGDPAVIHRIDVIRTQINLAALHELMGEHTRALDTNEQALNLYGISLKQALAPDIPPPEGARPIFENLAVIYEHSSHREEAMSLRLRAQQISTSELIHALPTYGGRVDISGETAAAESETEQSLAQNNLIRVPSMFSRSMGPLSLRVKHLTNIGLTSLSHAHYDSAEAAFWKAFMLVANSDALSDQAYLADELRKTYELKKQLGPAIFFGKLAVNALQRERKGLSTINRNLPQSFTVDRHSTYTSLADDLLQAQRETEAGLIIELQRAQDSDSLAPSTAKFTDQQLIYDTSEKALDQAIRSFIAAIQPLTQKYDAHQEDYYEALAKFTPPQTHIEHEVDFKETLSTMLDRLTDQLPEIHEAIQLRLQIPKNNNFRVDPVSHDKTLKLSNFEREIGIIKTALSKQADSNKSRQPFSLIDHHGYWLLKPGQPEAELTNLRHRVSEYSNDQAIGKDQAQNITPDTTNQLQIDQLVNEINDIQKILSNTSGFINSIASKPATTISDKGIEARYSLSIITDRLSDAIELLNSKIISRLAPLSSLDSDEAKLEVKQMLPLSNRLLDLKTQASNLKDKTPILDDNLPQSIIGEIQSGLEEEADSPQASPLSNAILGGYYLAQIQNEEPASRLHREMLESGSFQNIEDEFDNISDATGFSITDFTNNREELIQNLDTYSRDFMTMMMAVAQNPRALTATNSAQLEKEISNINNKQFYKLMSRTMHPEHNSPKLTVIYSSIQSSVIHNNLTILESQLEAQRPQLIENLQQEAQHPRFLPAEKQELDHWHTTLAQLPDTAALTYLIGEHRLWILLESGKGSRIIPVDTSAIELTSLISRYQKVLGSSSADPFGVAKALDQLLMAPVESELDAQQIHTVLLSLDGTLRYLPFGALHDGQHWRAERYAFSLRNERTIPTSARSMPNAQWRAAGFGAVTADPLHPLPNVKLELEKIITDPAVQSNGVLAGDIRIDQQFTEDALESALKQHHQIVHIASHFQFNSVTGESALLLGDGQELSIEAMKAKNLRFDGIALLTLSACKTGMDAHNDFGEEFEGMSRFARAQGAEAVLASLWPVDDSTTAELMSTLYATYIHGGSSRASALQAAQLQLLRKATIGAPLETASNSTNREGGRPITSSTLPSYTPDPQHKYAHPYYWAPFVLTGDWR